MHFTQLRLQGFKSFVDKTDLPIGEGLTGIVGPNGCGKSNLVEALRWVMGETSPKRMRGSGMEDVIFAGTTTRPSRNLAEASLFLDNAQRTATAEYNATDEILVGRKIERGNGSDYRINGRPVRQRDVQLLFADQSTGAHSTSVVGQGQIDALIRAKPKDRRKILEEASGTAGLQARRHEAELKLKAADQNLTRVDDVLKTLDAQLRSLKQQVRQASRYRNLAEHIRKTEAGLLHLRWIETEGNAASTHEALSQAQSQANELLAQVTRSTTEKTTVAAEFPALRQAEATAAAIVQKLTLAREQIEQEAKRALEDATKTESHLAQAQSDLTREETHHHDGQNAIVRLATEKEELTIQVEEISASLPKLNEILTATTEDVHQRDNTLAERINVSADAQARQQSLARELETLINQQANLTQRRTDIEAQRTAIVAAIGSRPDLSLTAAMVEACETELERRQEQAAAAEQARRDSEEAQNASREAATAAQNEVMKQRAEVDAITRLLAHDDTAKDQVIDLITVTPGLEKALAVALGEALSASLDPSAAMHWRDLGELEQASALPAPAAPLTSAIHAPPALARSLSQIGLVENREQGEQASASLQPGQILVSRDGWAWRWDGFTLSPEAQTASAMRLEQRNRLTHLKEKIESAEKQSEEAQTALQETTSILQQCQSLDQQTRQALQAAFAALNDARTTFEKQKHEATEAHTKLKVLDETAHEIVQDTDALRVRAVEIEQERIALPNIEKLQAEIAMKRIDLAEAREKQAHQQSEKDGASGEHNRITTRLVSVEEELSAWQERMNNAQEQSASLRERIAKLESNLITLRGFPAELDQKRDALMSELSKAEKTRGTAADILISTEQKLSVVEHKLKTEEANLGTAREERVRAEAAVTAAKEHLDILRERMEEKLKCTPENLREIAAFKEDADLPSIFELEQLLGRFNRERENMGPVNLRAEVETENAKNEIDKLTQEKEDLTAAIGKLRQGISKLNREARERLNNAFAQVNERFQKLFTTLFGGGTAYLELIDNEDPMDAGLEIFAAPPGKKQQVLSLLSGGERTLTALALLFAVFQTNPSPICVLDEAEAALDESNITRFCDLVQMIAKETKTRFLIITHQRLTMAHMDRLFGVTMSEKGVSQLVSVDLAGAVALRESAEASEAATQATETLKAVQAA